MKEIREFINNGVKYRLTLEVVGLTDKNDKDCEKMDSRSALISVSMDYGKRLAEEEKCDKALEDFAHTLKEDFNMGTPSDVSSNESYWTLEGIRNVIDRELFEFN